MFQGRRVGSDVPGERGQVPDVPEMSITLRLRALMMVTVSRPAVGR